MATNAEVPRGVIRRNRLSDWADKWLFILIFLIGTFLIIFLKAFGVGQLFVTLAPVSAMLFYGLYVLLTPRYRLRDDRAGDSLYYLGFLYTMVSLAYSLYEFRGGQGATTSIVTNFGIALATTIIGLMLRVVYHQLRQDPFGVERQVHMQLNEAAEQLRGQLLEAVTNFNSLRTAITQSLTEAEEETTKAVRGAAGILSEHSTLIKQRATQIVSALERMVKRLDKVEVPPDMLTTKVEHIVEQLDNAVQSALKRMETEQGRIGDLEKLIEQTSGLTTKLKEDITALQTEALTQRDAIRLAMKNLESSVDSVTSTASAVVAIANKNAEDHRILLQALEKESAAALRAVAEHREKIIADVKVSTEMLSQVHGSLVSLTRTIVEKLNGKRI